MIQCKKSFLKIIFFIVLLFVFNKTWTTDLSIIGTAWFAESLARIPIWLIDMLKDDLEINFIPSTNSVNFKDIPDSVAKIIKNKNNSEIGCVALLTTQPYIFYNGNYIDINIKSNKIKLAYTMFEAESIPAKWVDIFNNRFDAIVVPDNFCLDIYQKSGIKVPIFVLPLAIYLEEFLVKEVKKNVGKPFVFGMSGTFGWRKNQKLIIEAFAEEFGNNPDVLLKLHGRNGNKEEYLQLIKKYNLKNVQLIDRVFDHKEYINFMYSLDCYVLFSHGEGFSISPREALALGIPCILSNNSGHKTICQTGFVRAVPSNILSKVIFNELDGHITYMYGTNLEDARQALKDVYNNYEIYKNKALKGRQWVQQYLIPNLKQRYLNLIKPKKILFGNKNVVTDNYFMTNSKALFKKYNQLLKKEFLN